MKRLQNTFREIFSFDVRSLALFRVCLSLLIIFDLATRTTSLKAHYTDFGVLPRAPLLEQFISPWRLSLHVISGHPSAQIALFILAAFFAVMLMVGYRTRFATFASWVMLVSLHNRNPMLLQAGDLYFHMLLFWSLFLPLGASGSVDRMRLQDDSKQPPVKWMGAGTAGYLLQIAFVYWFTAAHKLAPNAFPIWWEKGLAVYYALDIEQFTTPVGQFLVQFPFLTKILNYAVILFEIFGPFLLMFPIATAWVRLTGVFAIILLHMSFGISMVLGTFPWVCTVAVVALLPSLFWDKIMAASFFRQIGSGLRAAAMNIYFALTSIGVISGRKILVYPNDYFVLRPKPGVHLFAAFCLIYILLWNIGNIFPKYAMPRQYHVFGILLSLDQKWDMFSPPLRDDGWYVIPGNLRNGREVDLFRGGADLSWDKPKLVSSMYHTARWRKYMMNLWLASNREHRLYYGKYLCRDWNTRHTGGELLESFEILFIREMTPEPGEIVKPELKSIWKHWCFEIPEEYKAVGKA